MTQFEEKVNAYRENKRLKEVIDMTKRYSTEAATVAAAIKALAQRPDNLDNLESYLSTHFEVWLKRYANTPDLMAAELKDFANMDI